MIAEEFAIEGFFEGITTLLPVPLTTQRQRQRGYNQSVEIARGIHSATGLPLLERALERVTFYGSQTKKDRWQRNENVEKAFLLVDAGAVSHQHILLIDDIITSGATLTAAAKEVLRGDNVKVSVLSLGFAKNM